MTPPQEKVMKEEEEEEEEDAAADQNQIKKKKKNKKKKKVSNGPVKMQGIQSEPPTVPVSKLFPNNIYPVGEIQEYKDE
jgi:methionyl aminopeptidase